MGKTAKAKKLLNDAGISVSNLSKNTILAYAVGIKQYRAYLKKRRRADNLKSGNAWLRFIEKNKSASTFNLRLQAIKIYFEHMYADNPEKLWEVQKLKGRSCRTEMTCHSEKYLREDQMDRLSASMTKRISLISRALFWSGCRISELINIRFGDIETTLPDVALNIKVTGKGNKIRTVHLPYDLAEEIKSVFRGRKYLFETGKKKQYNRSHIYLAVSTQAKKIGMKVYPHMFRHSKAMYLKDVKKMSADQIAKALGHADVATTLKYYFHNTPTAVDQGM